MAVMLTCVLKWLGRRVAARAIVWVFDLALDRVLLLFPHYKYYWPPSWIWAYCLSGRVTSLCIRSIFGKYIIFHWPRKKLQASKSKVIKQIVLNLRKFPWCFTKFSWFTSKKCMATSKENWDFDLGTYIWVNHIVCPVQLCSRFQLVQP